jgi:single-stranded-DNA-specific exonuclease
MTAAVRRLYRAVNEGERVGVFGDFDVDGVTGTAIIAEGLSSLGIPVTPYLPHRVDEGHGLSTDAIDQLAAEGVTLIITVDTGVTASAEVAYAGSKGVDAIITDHHLPHDRIPEAAAIINPKLPGSAYPFFELCGAGLGFKLVQGLFQFYGQPWDHSLLELAALGTIADLVPMLDENRYLVSEGVRLMTQTQRPGLRALYDAARVRPEEIDVETLSFQIVPRLNSAGRMGHPMDSFRLLTTRSVDEAKDLARKLDELNLERREATRRAFDLACQRVEAMEHLPAVLVVADETIPRGVAGLVAGRLCDQFRRPSVVLAVEEEYAVASGRSIPEFNIVDAIASAEEYAVASGRSIPEFNIVDAIASAEDLVLRYGGHSQAAGFTLHRRSIPDMAARLDAYAAETLEEPGLDTAVDIDAVVSLAELDRNALEWVSTLEPYGPGNPRPVFASLGVSVREWRTMGYSDQHVRFVVEQGGTTATALAFNQGQFWDPKVRLLDLVYTLTTDTWQGNNALTLKVSHFRPAQAVTGVG